MRFPQVGDRVKEAPAHALRAMFAGIGQMLLVADRMRSRPADPETDRPAGAEHLPAAKSAQRRRAAEIAVPAAVPAASHDGSRWRSLDKTGNVRILPVEYQASQPVGPAAVKTEPTEPPRSELSLYRPEPGRAGPSGAGTHRARNSPSPKSPSRPWPSRTIAGSEPPSPDPPTQSRPEPPLAEPPLGAGRAARRPSQPAPAPRSRSSCRFPTTTTSPSRRSGPASAISTPLRSSCCSIMRKAMPPARRCWPCTSAGSANSRPARADRTRPQLTRRHATGEQRFSPGSCPDRAAARR